LLLIINTIFRKINSLFSDYFKFIKISCNINVFFVKIIFGKDNIGR